jgi:hypothetical protein
MSKRVNVVVDGVSWGPISNKPNAHQVNRLSEILASEFPWMVRSKRDRVIRRFKDRDDVVLTQSKTKTEIPKKSTKAKSKLFNYGNFIGFDDDGHILMKGRGPSKTKWTIHQVIGINQYLLHGKKDKVTVRELSKKFNLSKDLTKTIVYNLKNGELSVWIDRWVAQGHVDKKTVQVENNPQKRKEVGWY